MYMRILDAIHGFEYVFMLIITIDLLLSLLFLKSQSMKINKLEIKIQKFYGFFSIVYQGMRELGSAMKRFHLSLDKFYQSIPIRLKKIGNGADNFHQSLDNFYFSIPECIKIGGRIIRKFHTGKINSYLLYFVACMLLSLILIYVVN